MSDQPKTPLILKWSMRHYVLEVDDRHESIDDAVTACYWAVEAGVSNPLCIEAWLPNAYQRLDEDEIFECVAEIEAKRKRDQTVPEPLPIVAKIFVVAPPGLGVAQRESLYDTYTDLDAARRDLAKLAALTNRARLEEAEEAGI
jgi:hypothetical protein